jgi:hypothetical protein
MKNRACKAVQLFDVIEKGTASRGLTGACFSPRPGGKLRSVARCVASRRYAISKRLSPPSWRVFFRWLKVKNSASGASRCHRRNPIRGVIERAEHS